jgi:hypothetical protein
MTVDALDTGQTLNRLYGALGCRLSHRGTLVPNNKAKRRKSLPDGNPHLPSDLLRHFRGCTRAQPYLALPYKNCCFLF